MIVNWPVGQYVHDTPQWDISGGFYDTSTGECQLSIAKADNSGWYNYTELALYLNLKRANGNVDYYKIFSGSGYEDMSGTIWQTSDGATECWLSMYCSMHDDGSGSCGNDWDLSPNAGTSADNRPGWEIPNTRMTLTTPPELSNLRNDNPYKDNSGISASTTSIRLKWDQTGGSDDTSAAYNLNNESSWHGFGSSKDGYTSGTISKLTPGTSYYIQVRTKNEAGFSNYLHITIRTRHNIPVVSITNITAELEALNVSWTSDKDIKTLQYQLNGTSGSWITVGQTGYSGTFRIAGLDYNTNYTVYLRGTSTSAYDSLTSNVVKSSKETLDISHITNISTLIFGTSFTVTISGESNNAMSLRIWTTGNSRTAEVTVTPQKGSNTITLTQSQLDNVYRTFPRANTMTMYFQLSTIGTQTYADTQTSRTLTLTGIARTAHIGVSNRPRRCDVYIGVGNRPRRCVTWIGVSGTARRCI